jgi:putative transposase
MPDHLHLLVEGTDAASDVRAFVHLAKQRTGFGYSRACSRRLWQPSYWDRVLRDEESTWSVIRYICDNPVRAGLVDQAHEYAYFGSELIDRETLLRELENRPYTPWQP